MAERRRHHRPTHEGGVEDADGFFLNASNYMETQRLEKYGTWISNCMQSDERVMVRAELVRKPVLPGDAG